MAHYDAGRWGHPRHQQSPIIATFICNPHFGKSYAINLNHAHEELQDLIERVTIELELLNVAG
ncbi:hypothetical protein RKLH11_4255 [Rhodobacteraceae bacterium KLH11]|nr:hypothetical protein RKLH11_4255 [Rhodobacteraceae bacterium KLH11]